MTQLGIRSIPVKVNLDRVNLNDDSFLNDMELELPDFESSFESQDNEADKLKKLGNNLNHINVEINKGSTVEGDKGLLKHVEQNDIDLKRKVANNKINSELNYTNDIHLLDYRPEDESGNVDQSQSNSSIVPRHSGQPRVQRQKTAEVQVVEQPGTGTHPGGVSSLNNTMNNTLNRSIKDVSKDKLNSKDNSTAEKHLNFDELSNVKTRTVEGKSSGSGLNSRDLNSRELDFPKSNVKPKVNLKDIDMTN
eukprot:CAMPEP_0116972300 /NCGR_PEP_ID=MMETSP0467-20121206/53757_1 /TAXON_ID=283647 /ORGANISM="Mesodinium pulex, Strain SPMC105" /LENGTH=249 /DNA_ID=CAMNT_0004663759 /DNA_START=2061 /DNA_END=2810 /DNA_ORIENTATION=-